MAKSNLFWNRLRRLNKFPGAYQAYKIFMKFYLRDGQIVSVKRGPIAGYKWRHYQIYQPWMAMGLYEPDVANFIYSRLQPGQVFFDVGANAGYFTLVGAKKVGDLGKVVAFDPVPQNIQTVNEQIELNKLTSSCVVEPLAISSYCGQTKLILPERNANAHLANIEAPHVNLSQKTIIDVESITFDEYVAGGITPHFIKVDIEGAEVEALLGATNLLRDSAAPEWLITAHSTALSKEVVRILKSAGYRIDDFPHMIHGVPLR